MRTADIMEVFVSAIDEKIGKEYVLKIREIKDGEHWAMEG